MCDSRCDLELVTRWIRPSILARCSSRAASRLKGAREWRSAAALFCIAPRALTSEIRLYLYDYSRLTVDRSVNDWPKKEIKWTRTYTYDVRVIWMRQKRKIVLIDARFYLVVFATFTSYTWDPYAICLFIWVLWAKLGFCVDKFNEILLWHIWLEVECRMWKFCGYIFFSE